MKFWYAVEPVSRRATWLCGVPTFQEGLEVIELAGIVELSEVLGLLGQVFPLCQRVSLVCDDV
jgi:hypothetical protein